MTDVATTHEVSRRFGAHLALDGVSVSFAEHRIHGLLGRNGAGKTTLMQILTAQQFPTAGRATVFGEDPYENADVLARTCSVREAMRYPDAYRVRDALRAAAAVHPRWDGALADELVDAFALPLKQRCKSLSRGQLSAVGAVIGLASRAELTFFDEPSLGLDAVARRTFHDRLLADFAEHPRTVVLSTHLIDEVAGLVDRVVVLDRGRVLIDADTDALRGSAVTVTGPAAAVERFAAAAHAVELHRERLGGVLRLTLTDVPASASAPEGLALEPLSLQDLVVHTTQHSGRAAAARTDVQEVGS